MAALMAAVAAVVLAGACTAPARTATATLAPAAAVDSTARPLAAGLRIAERFRVEAITKRRFTHAELWRAVEPFTTSPSLSVEPIGRSVLGREIRAVTFGRGPTTVLLWSQMHGDESTATMALADIFRFLAEAADDPLRQRLERDLTIVFVPMLNPDGAEVFRRHNALGIDVNRDGRRLASPEARALKGIHDRLRPAFGFNLHDQSARTRAGKDGPQTGIALLAPAFDESRSYNAVRSRARLVAATMAHGLAGEIPGRVAKYDDSFNPRAFGDLVQQWGTSTVLVESGALPDDPQKQRLRALNVAAILAGLDAIATGSYAGADPAAYDSLPFNADGARDLLILGGRVVFPGREPVAADLAVDYDDPVARTGGRVREVGDLRGAVAIDTVDAAGLFIHPDTAALARDSDGVRLPVGAPARFDLRRGAGSASALVRRIGE